jgi:hypothetical protein
VTARPFSAGDPRRREEPGARFPRIHEAPDALSRGVPAALADLILRMPGKDPAERPVASEVVAVLEPLVADITAARRRRRGHCPVPVIGGGHHLSGCRGGR